MPSLLIAVCSLTLEHMMDFDFTSMSAICGTMLIGYMQLVKRYNLKCPQHAVCNIKVVI